MKRILYLFNVKALFNDKKKYPKEQQKAKLLSFNMTEGW